MAMYHSWGTQNAWLRQLHGRNPLYVPTKIWEKHSFAEGDWAKVSSPAGEITVPVAHMAALNENTVWTWNAIGKRKGAWALDEKAPEVTEGFLLNHLIIGSFIWFVATWDAAKEEPISQTTSTNIGAIV